MKILFLASNPQSTGRLNLAKEAREIQEGLKIAKLADKFKFVQWGAVRSRDLRRALLQEFADKLLGIIRSKINLHPSNQIAFPTIPPGL